MNTKIPNNINCVTTGDIKIKILDINVVRAPETPFIIISAIIPISNIFSILAVLIKNKFCIFFTYLSYSFRTLSYLEIIQPAHTFRTEYPLLNDFHFYLLLQ